MWSWTAVLLAQKTRATSAQGGRRAAPESCPMLLALAPFPPFSVSPSDQDSAVPPDVTQTELPHWYLLFRLYGRPGRRQMGKQPPSDGTRSGAHSE